MTSLMIYAGACSPVAPELRTGGHPLAPPTFEWPSCRTCQGAMQFLAHLPIADSSGDRVVAVFMCANDPGLCDEWDPVAGGNHAYSFRGPLTAHAPPAVGETTLGAVSRAVVEQVAEPGYEQARLAWTERSGESHTQVLGGLGGDPEWYQDDETPSCDSCGTAMQFVAHLEQGHDRATAINFGGGGVGYVFECVPHATAAFLFQC